MWTWCCRRLYAQILDRLFVAVVILTVMGTESFAGEKFVYEKRNRDPFQSLVTEDGKLLFGSGILSLEDVYLEGIVWDPNGESVAMINGMILRQGDRIGDLQILKIESDRVVLEADGEERSLLLQEEF